MSSSIVIGAGHNGLVVGLYLAKAGRKVTIVERRGDVGGLCAAMEFHSGYTVPGLLHDTTGVRRTDQAGTARISGNRTEYISAATY